MTRRILFLKVISKMRQRVQFQTSLFFLKNFILGKSKWSAAKGISGLVVKALRSQSRVPYSKPLDGSKVDLAFHPSKVTKMSTRNFWELSGKN